MSEPDPAADSFLIGALRETPDRLGRGKRQARSFCVGASAVHVVGDLTLGANRQSPIANRQSPMAHSSQPITPLTSHLCASSNGPSDAVDLIK